MVYIYSSSTNQYQKEIQRNCASCRFFKLRDHDYSNQFTHTHIYPKQQLRRKKASTQQYKNTQTPSHPKHKHTINFTSSNSFTTYYIKQKLYSSKNGGKPKAKQRILEGKANSIPSGSQTRLNRTIWWQ